MFLRTEIIFENGIKTSIEDFSDIIKNVIELHGEYAEVSVLSTEIKSLNTLLITSERGPSNG